MVLGRKPKKDPGAPLNVGLIPEIHKLVGHDCIERGQSMRARVNEILAEHYGRPDLLSPCVREMASAAP